MCLILFVVQKSWLKSTVILQKALSEGQHCLVFGLLFSFCIALGRCWKYTLLFKNQSACAPRNFTVGILIVCMSVCFLIFTVSMLPFEIVLIWPVIVTAHLYSGILFFSLWTIAHILRMIAHYWKMSSDSCVWTTAGRKLIHCHDVDHPAPLL